MRVNVSEAASELVCKQSNDNEHCLSAFGSDRRLDSKFPDLRKNLTDEVGQRRLAASVCKWEGSRY